jgi:hypothetical protein
MPTRATLQIHAFCLLAVAITVVAIIPGQFAHDFMSGTSKHVLAFVVLTIGAIYLWPRTHGFVLWTGLSAFGGGIEILQAAMAMGRMADWNDWTTDAVTAALVLLVFSAVRGFPGLDPLAQRRAKADEIAELRELIRGLGSNA